VKIHPSHCHPKQPSIVCPGRADSVRRGAFWWEMKIGGYVSTDIAKRETNWRGKYYNGDHTGELYRLEICPWCGMELPQLFPDPSEMSVTDGEDGN
jgi:hypothetical protein